MKRTREMNQRLKAAMAGVVVTAAALTSGCVVRETVAPVAPGPGAYYDYYYYPDCEVYFYPVTGTYWWIDGGVWISGPRPPAQFVLREDARVTVRLNSERPWTEHRTVIRRYPRPEQRREWPREERRER
jgi:hypothetical protein